MKNITSQSVEALTAELSTLSEKLRELRFQALGGKNKNTKQTVTIRKTIAQIHTHLSATKND